MERGWIMGIKGGKRGWKWEDAGGGEEVKGVNVRVGVLMELRGGVGGCSWGVSECRCREVS